jgi:hypothetical protein
MPSASASAAGGVTTYPVSSPSTLLQPLPAPQTQTQPNSNGKARSAVEAAAAYAASQQLAAATTSQHHHNSLLPHQQQVKGGHSPYPSAAAPQQQPAYGQAQAQPPSQPRRPLLILKVETPNVGEKELYFYPVHKGGIHYFLAENESFVLTFCLYFVDVLCVCV